MYISIYTSMYIVCIYLYILCEVTIYVVHIYLSYVLLQRARTRPRTPLDISIVCIYLSYVYIYRMYISIYTIWNHELYSTYVSIYTIWSHDVYICIYMYIYIYIYVLYNVTIYTYHMKSLMICISDMLYKVTIYTYGPPLACCQYSRTHKIADFWVAILRAIKIIY